MKAPGDKVWWRQGKREKKAKGKEAVGQEKKKRKKMDGARAPGGEKRKKFNGIQDPWGIPRSEKGALPRATKPSPSSTASKRPCPSSSPPLPPASSSSSAFNQINYRLPDPTASDRDQALLIDWSLRLGSASTEAARRSNRGFPDGGGTDDGGGRERGGRRRVEGREEKLRSPWSLRHIPVVFLSRLEVAGRNSDQRVTVHLLHRRPRHPKKSAAFECLNPLQFPALYRTNQNEHTPI